jgi:hypothetical protein
MYQHRYRYLLTLSIALFSLSSVFAIIPSGYYYFARNKKQAALKTALHTYCAPMFEYEYGGGAGFTWQGFFYTDQNADGSVIDMYSDSVRYFSGFKAVSGMNIEHSLPKSWWGSFPNNAYKDLFHLYPADGITNIIKNNLPLGEVTGIPSMDNGKSKVGKNGFETAYTDNCFEPADEYKGDFARSYFYISTIYENYASLWSSPMMNNNTYPVWKPWAIDLLLKWSHQDPVSPKELARIEAIYNIQGNRNPFIDYPDLADYIWGKDTLNVYPFPDETNPFLVMPRRGTTIDFGVILQNDVRTQTLHIQGANISSDLQVSLVKNSSTITLSTPVIPADSALNGFNLSITFTPVTTGFVRDTLVIQGGGITETLRIPVQALASADFITLEPTDITPVGGTLQWISDPLATGYKLNLYQGDKQAGDLIISTYVDGSSWNKALELYNGTGRTIDLSNYSLQKQSNGSGYFGSTLKLSGMLDNNKSYVIVSRSCTTADLVAKAQLLTDSVLQYNGNDAVALVRSGVTIDMVGQADAGADVIWGDKVTLQRNPGITHPASTFNGAEWSTLPSDSYAMLGNHPMTLATSSTYLLQDALTGKITSYPLLNLSPDNIYTYSVEAIRPDGNTAAINTMQLHTSQLDAPEISDPDNILSNQFTANWGETAYASGYLLDVFTISGQADTTEVEAFNNVGTSGTPLPTGWSGTASGNYTSSASQGIAPPSVAFKNAGEWLQTKTYPQPVSGLSFMCRFATYEAGASLLLEGLSNGNWIPIDTIICKNNSKVYPVYSFDKSQGLNSFRFTFNKMPGGNLSLDDVSATYGNQDTVYQVKNKPVTFTYSVIQNLKENSPYFYRVKATLGSVVSANSETIGVMTLLNSKVQQQTTNTVKISSKEDKITITGLRGDELIQVYSVTGICLFQTKTNTTEKDIAMHQSGIFLIRVQDRLSNSTFKIIR